MHFTETQTLTEKQKLEIIELWNKEYPMILQHQSLADFEQYLAPLSDKKHILLSDEEGGVKGWLIYFIRDEEQYFAIILDDSLHGKGWGSRFLGLAKERTMELNGWVLDNDDLPKQNGERYRSPVEFYRKNGFAIRTDIRLEKKKIGGIKVIWRSDQK